MRRPVKKPARHSITINGDVYARLKAYCQSFDVSMASTVERLIEPTIAKAPENLLDAAIKRVAARG